MDTLDHMSDAFSTTLPAVASYVLAGGESVHGESWPCARGAEIYLDELVSKGECVFYHIVIPGEGDITYSEQ